jgi:hypothetical protein
MAMAGLVLTACSDEVESTFGNDALAVKFTANVGTASRSANSYIANGATVKISNGGKYFGYVAGDDGNLTPTDGDFIRWSSMSQGSMAITAYTPATDAASISSFTIAADQSSAAALAAADYATFDGTVSRLANSNNVSFELTRQLAQVNVNIASVDKRYTDTDDDKFTFDVTVFSPSTTVTAGSDGVSGDGKALEVTPYSSSATASTAIIAAGQADDAAKFLAVQVKKNGTAVGNPLIALGRPALEVGNSYTLNLTVLYDEVSISSVQLTDWVTVDTIEGGEAEKEPIPDELVINLQKYSSEEAVRSAISNYCNKVEGDIHVSVVGKLNGWSLLDVLGSGAFWNYNQQYLKYDYDDYEFHINYLNLDGISDLTELPEGCLYGSSTLKSISATQVTTLGRDCLGVCQNLTEVNFPAVKDVKTRAFEFCPSLPTLSLPNAETFGDDVLAWCTSLISIYLPKVTEFSSYPLSSAGNPINTDLTLNESQRDNVDGTVWKINNTTSNPFKSITLVNVVNLQDYDSASDIRNAIYSSSNVILEGQLNGMSLSDIFYNTEVDWSIVSLNLDGITDLTEIPAATFSRVKTLEKLSATQVIKLGSSCFNYNYQLKEVNLPSVEYVNQCAFGECISLTSISLPKAETVYINAFDGCKSLTSVYIPNATEFGYSIFSGCTTENIDLTLNESQRENVSGNTWTYTSDAYTSSYTFKSITLE